MAAHTFTTDEVSGAYLAYNISDLNNIRFLDKYRNEDTQVGKVIFTIPMPVKIIPLPVGIQMAFLFMIMTRPENIVKG